MDDVNPRQQWIEATISFIRSAFAPSADAETKREAAGMLVAAATMLDPSLGAAATPPAGAASTSAPTSTPRNSGDRLDQIIGYMQRKLDESPAPSVPYTAAWPWPQR